MLMNAVDFILSVKMLSLFFCFSFFGECFYSVNARACMCVCALQQVSLLATRGHCF